MLWKIYAWIFTIVAFVGIPFFIYSIESWNFASWESIVEGVILAIGVLAFSYKKVLLQSGFWKFAFIVILISWIVDITFYAFNLPFPSFLKLNIPVSTTEVPLLILFSVPAFIPIYRMGFSRKTA